MMISEIYDHAMVLKMYLILDLDFYNDGFQQAEKDRLELEVNLETYNYN